MPFSMIVTVFNVVIASFMTNKNTNAKQWIRVWSHSLKLILVCTGD